MSNQNEESRHYAQIWAKVIEPVCEVVISECDEDFRQKCFLEPKSTQIWKKDLENEYRSLRREMKELCYGDKADDGLLDSRKLSAIFCKALMRIKAYQYNVNEARRLVEKKKQEMPPAEFNLWAVDTVYINYKLAYYVSLQLVYLTLLDDLKLSGDIDKLRRLNDIGHLIRYPWVKDMDSFDVNVIIGMARADISGKGLDMFLFAMQLYQIEMYTRERLK